MTTVREQVLTGLKWTAGGKLGAQVITWAITLVVMRLLTPEDYGLLAMASVFVAFMLMLSEAGLGPALIQKQDLDETALRSVFAIVIIANISLLLLLNLLTPFIAAFFDEERLIPILHVLSLQFLLTIFGTLPSVQLYRQLKFRSLSLISFLTTIVGSILTLVLAFAQFGVWALVLGNLFASILSVIAMNVVAPLHFLPKFSVAGMRNLLSFGGNITLSRLLWFFFTQADAVIVGKLLGKEILGFYSIAMQLASLPVQRISSIINQVAFPVFSRIQDNPEQFRSFILKAMRVLSLIAFPVLWGISSVANEIVLLFLGQKWHIAILPLQLLALMMPLRMIVNFLPTAIDALGRPDVGVKNVLLASIVMPLALLAGSYWGIVGVALAWVTVYPLVLLVNIHRMLQVIALQLSDFFYAIAPATGSAIGMYLTVWGVGLLFTDDINQWAKLSAMITAGILVYGGLTLFFNRHGYHEVVDLIRKR
ncbi:Membrane protein involved in the export of O-antigen and teichoic acid [Nitrosomonas eutropha]|uniref:Membrane protein involved in the export of O-antigen and teichoic acid n=1 Tax=Nitrosomonas eutropha TaxID=916 RepID=A0A1I7GSW8_9PROT|nr:lipopolysaccharide biosynthesis protein [Nitrosomonas eutropha]SFU51552.1 Membrane protein involved in the export of O-antigen and teichoic acid [Nitrosomonas eutropha]